MKNLYGLILFLVFNNLFGQSPVPSGAKLDTVVSGLYQLEGPVWKDGLGLLFSDIFKSKIHLWSPTSNTTSIYLSPSDSSNGLTLDQQGRIILTQMYKRRVARQELDGSITSLASTFRGKKFNSPNDLVVKSDGAIFFTDPDFNIPGGASKKELTFQGVYRISPYGSITLLDSVFDKPNGICFSPDESKLYVNESPLGKIYVWDVEKDSTIVNKQLLYTIPLGGYADGMKVDTSGNIYCTGPTGVWIVSPNGNYLDKIATPRNPSNCTWGDADKKTLYITTGNSTQGTGFIYRIRLAVNTNVKDQGFMQPNNFELYQNFPNPFNPSTTINYHLPNVVTQYIVSLRVFDTLGREITTLVNEEKPAGVHQVHWDASRTASGLYFCKLFAVSLQDHNKKFSETKKMLLLR